MSFLGTARCALSGQSTHNSKHTPPEQSYEYQGGTPHQRPYPRRVRFDEWLLGNWILFLFHLKSLATLASHKDNAD